MKSCSENTTAKNKRPKAAVSKREDGYVRKNNAIFMDARRRKECA